MTSVLCLFIALFLFCFGLGLVFLVYTWILWASSLLSPADGAADKVGEKGLSTAELERLGDGGGAAAGQECAVCLDDIEAGQASRVLPGCQHAFHRACADRWLAAHPDCPLCRAHLDPPPMPPPPIAPPSVPVEVVICA